MDTRVIPWLSASAVALAALTAGNAAAQGLYVRIGAGLDAAALSRLLDGDCAETDPPALFGCGAGEDGDTLSAVGDFGNSLMLDLGVGVTLLLGLRAELSVHYRPNSDFEGNANFLGAGASQPVQGSGWSIAVMANAYLDLSAIGLPRLGPLHPFIGAGIGLAYNSIGAIVFDFPELGTNAATVTMGGDSGSLAYMLTVGVSLPVTDRLEIDLAYRYSDLGSVRTDAGLAEIIRDFGTTILAIGSTTADLRSHGLVASVRVGF
jgi:opacity protein-like surface antigen